MFENRTKDILLYAQLDQKEGAGKLPPHLSMPFHWSRADLSARLVVKIQGHARRSAESVQWLWSQGFPVHQVGTFFIKLYNTQQEVEAILVNQSPHLSTGQATKCQRVIERRCYASCLQRGGRDSTLSSCQ